jgi:hypothetical protein
MTHLGPGSTALLVQRFGWLLQQSLIDVGPDRARQEAVNT